MAHIRSISLPTRSRPLSVTVGEQLNKLKASQSSSISQKLNGLKSLYESVDDLLQLPITQQTLSHQKQSQWMEEALNGSLWLLDLCSTSRDIFLQMKECVQGIELSLRRRRGGDLNLASEIDAYMSSKKKLNKAISKSSKSLKKRKAKNNITASSDKNLAAVIDMLSDVEEISLAMFESILCFVSDFKTRSKASSWSVVSKLLQPKRVWCESEYGNEMEKIDAELLALKSSKDVKPSQVQNVVKGLEALELSIEGVEEELEFVYRQLLKSRVSLLNILNH